MNREHFEVGSTQPSSQAAHSQAAKQHTAKQSCLALVSSALSHSLTHTQSMHSLTNALLAPFCFVLLACRPRVGTSRGGREEGSTTRSSGERIA